MVPLIINKIIGNAELELELEYLPLNPILGTPTLRSMSMSNLDPETDNLEVARAQSVEDLRSELSSFAFKYQSINHLHKSSCSRKCLPCTVLLLTINLHDLCRI